MYFPEPVFDQYSGLNVQTTGCIHLDGIHALQVVRARHLQYKGPGVTSDDPYYWPQEGESDLARIRRDHEFLRVLATAVAQRGLGNLLTDERIISSVAPQLVVDSGFSTSNMVNLALTYHATNAYDVPQLTLPVMVGSFGQYYYEGGGYGDVEFPSEPQDQAVIDQFLGVSSSTDTMNGGSLPEPGHRQRLHPRRLGDLSRRGRRPRAGCRRSGSTWWAAATPRPSANEAETVVEYSQDTPANEAAAQAVAHAFTGPGGHGHGPDDGQRPGHRRHRLGLRRQRCPRALRRPPPRGLPGPRRPPRRSRPRPRRPSRRASTPSPPRSRRCNRGTPARAPRAVARVRRADSQLGRSGRGGSRSLSSHATACSAPRNHW